MKLPERFLFLSIFLKASFEVLLSCWLPVDAPASSLACLPFFLLSGSTLLLLLELDFDAGMETVTSFNCSKNNIKHISKIGSPFPQILPRNRENNGYTRCTGWRRILGRKKNLHHWKRLQKFLKTSECIYQSSTRRKTMTIYVKIAIYVTKKIRFKIG